MLRTVLGMVPVVQWQMAKQSRDCLVQWSKPITWGKGMLLHGQIHRKATTEQFQLKQQIVGIFGECVVEIV